MAHTYTPWSLGCYPDTSLLLWFQSTEVKVLFTVQPTARTPRVAHFHILMFLKSGWSYISFFFSVHHFSYSQKAYFLLSFFPSHFGYCSALFHTWFVKILYIYLKCAILLLLSEVRPAFRYNYFSVRLQCQQLPPHSCQLKHKCARLLFLEKQFKMWVFRSTGLILHWNRCVQQ